MCLFLITNILLRSKNKHMAIEISSPNFRNLLCFIDLTIKMNSMSTVMNFIHYYT